jgi:Flp pilus assembly protein TadG
MTPNNSNRAQASHDRPGSSRPSESLIQTTPSHDSRVGGRARGGNPGSLRDSGQTTVEFALVAIVLFVMVFAIFDFGTFFAGKVTATNAARTAARYAATHPTAWTNAASPPSNTIQGRLVSAAVPAQVRNDDAHITISYIVPGVGGGANCGHYSAASNSFVAAAGYTQATCVVPGSLVQVQVHYIYTLATPALSAVGINAGSITVDAVAAELEER